MLFVGALGLGENLAHAKKSSTKKTQTQSVDTKRGYYLDLMFNAWAVNKHAVNGPGYLKAADTLHKDEYEALKVYLKPIAINPVKELKSVQELAQQNSSVYGLFKKLEAKAPLNAQDVARWKESLNKVHKRLLAALEQRIGSDFTYSAFLRAEQERTLGNYQAAYVSRTALSKQVTRLEAGNKETQVELWSLVMGDPHTEMLIRMRQGVEILHATFLDFERQRFQIPEASAKEAKGNDTVDTSPDAEDRSHIRSGAPPFEKGPNPLLPPPRESE